MSNENNIMSIELKTARDKILWTMIQSVNYSLLNGEKTIVWKLEILN